jgi:carbonic anhydrase
MQQLIEGYRRFRLEQWPEWRPTFERLANSGQAPSTMIITCSDSRVDPSMIFGAEPGNMFVLRNVAALVPPYEPDSASHGTSAALEFAVRVLEVKNLIVMGHAMCGGIRVLLQGAPDPAGDFLLPWMRIADRAKRRVLERASADPQTECEQESVKVSLENLRTFPWIDDRVASGKLVLTGQIFDIRTGILTMLGPDGSFAPVPVDEGSETTR